MFGRTLIFLGGSLFGASSIYAWGFLRAIRRRQSQPGAHTGVYL